MKGFIEVTTKESFDYGYGNRGVVETKVLCHYTQIVFKYKSCYLMGDILKESYDQIKELIKEATV